jgi:FixJ family two-component response regulator
MKHTIKNSGIIAIVDDDDSVRMALDSLLRSFGYKVRTYSRALQFLYAKETAETDCLISDVQMPGLSGVELHEQLIAGGIHIPTIFITAYPEAISHLGTHTPTVIACLPKPCDGNKLLNYIEIALVTKDDCSI